MLAWETSATADGAHDVSVAVTDATGETALSPSLSLTVDNAPPEATMYAPPAGSRDDGPTSFQVHASDTFGVASVQFTIDGAPASGSARLNAFLAAGFRRGTAGLRFYRR